MVKGIGAGSAVKYAAAVTAALSLLITVLGWSDSLNDAAKTNAQSIVELKKDEAIHRTDHTTFRKEYREDQRRMDEKLDDVLNHLLEKGKTD